MQRCTKVIGRRGRFLKTPAPPPNGDWMQAIPKRRQRRWQSMLRQRKSGWCGHINGASSHRTAARSFADIVRNGGPMLQGSSSINERSRGMSPSLQIPVRPRSSRPPVALFEGRQCFRCGETGHQKGVCRNPMKCFQCLKFGHPFKTCKSSLSHLNKLCSSVSLSSKDKQQAPFVSHTRAADLPPRPSMKIPDLPCSNKASPPNRVKRSQAFLTFSSKMTEISNYLGRVAFVRSFGRPVKVDDVGSTLAHKARIPGSWMTRKLARDNEFFVSCPSCKVVQDLMELGHIHGEGFTLLVNHWDQTRQVSQHKLRFKASISLLNLPFVKS